MPLDDPLTYTLIALGAIVACLIVFYTMRRRKKGIGETLEKEQKKPNLEGLPFKIIKSVSPDVAGHAKDELRILELEREILSDAIRRLYEAHAVTFWYFGD